MNYQNFLGAVERGMEARLSDECSVSLHKTIKNNGQQKQGITIMKSGVNISPTIYLEDFYEQYREGKTLEEIVMKIDHFYHEVRYEKSLEVDFLNHFDKVKKRIVFKLINKEKNRELLNTIPYVEFQDLALTFYVLLDVCKDGSASMAVTNDWMHQWEMSVNDLYALAQHNGMRLLPAVFKPMQDVISELTGHPCDLMDDSLEEKKEDMMYVLTNEIRNLGAAVMAYDHILEMVADEVKKDYYILPSSIHEVIILPVNEGINRSDIDKTIREINETQVQAEEVLGSHAYYYDRIGKRLYF